LDIQKIPFLNLPKVMGIEYSPLPSSSGLDGFQWNKMEQC